MDMAESTTEHPVPKASLLHLLIVAGVLAVASLAPYATERLADYRYWDRLDASSLVRAATFTPPPKSDEAIAQGMPTQAAEELAGADLDQLAGVPSKPALPLQMAQASTPSEEAPPPQVAEIGSALDVTAEALGEQKVWVQGDLRVLDPFWQALADLAAGKRAWVRIAHYGDSHIANDGITHVTRQLLQRRFGDGGHGFTLVQGRTQWYSHKGVQRGASDGWRLRDFLHGNARDGAYGYGGVAADGGPGEWFCLDTTSKHAASRFTLYYRSQGKATVTVKIDGKSFKPLTITSASGTDGVETWLVPDGPHSIQWRVTAGKVRWYGGAVERDRGVVYDSLGEVGARGTRWLQADEQNLKTAMVERPVDLLIVNYGGNERSDKVSEATYLDKMGKTIERLRAGSRHGACLVLGPGDHGERERGKIISDPDIVRINKWQKTLATRAGCGFFDARDFMGGEGAMGRWVKGGLGWSDYSHFTAKGEQAMGLGLYRALLKGLQDWQNRTRTAAR
jgi:lysophospholipase L1-like esterase